jgi:hypothetical protein
MTAGQLAPRSSFSKSSSKDARQLAVSAYIAAAPGQVTVYTRAEPDHRSRTLTIEWWSTDGVGGSHQISLEGELSPARHDYAIKRLAEGTYQVSAVLTRNDGTQLRKETTVLVVGEGGRVDPRTFSGATGDITTHSIRDRFGRLPAFAMLRRGLGIARPAAPARRRTRDTSSHESRLCAV